MDAPDVTDARPSLHRAPPARSARPGAKVPEPGTPVAPCVVAALMRGQLELALLEKAAAGVARLELVDDRLALVSTIVATRPAALVLPPFDADHTSNAPLVLRMRREAPAVAILVISAHPAGAGQPILRAAQAGAYAITSPTAAELREVLATLVAPGGAAH